jgi:peptidoglycan hydrolase-like protein with peptidoglycan-binding domain
MRYYALASALMVAAAATSLDAPPLHAQTPSSLSYVQPLSPDSVASVQQKLQTAGVYTGRVDGVWGPDSDAALQRFQQAHQLQATGQLNLATAATLGLDASQFTASPPPAAPLPPPDHLRTASVRALQARLIALGFYRGPVDGVWGQSTETAVQTFQQGRGWPATGALTPATISALGLAPDAIAYR